MALKELGSFESAAQGRRKLRIAIEKVSARPGNTPTISINAMSKRFSNVAHAFDAA